MFLQGKICVSARIASRFAKIKYLRLYLTQIIHSIGKMLFFWQKICLSKFLWCAVHIKLFFASRKSSVFRTRRLTLSKKLNVYLRLHFIQIIHLYGKMLFLAPNNCSSLTFFKEKLCVSACVSKSLAWTVFTCVEKCYLSVVFAAWSWDWSVYPRFHLTKNLFIKVFMMRRTH